MQRRVDLAAAELGLEVEDMPFSAMTSVAISQPLLKTLTAPLKNSLPLPEAATKAVQPPPPKRPKVSKKQRRAEKAAKTAYQTCLGGGGSQAEARAASDMAFSLEMEDSDDSDDSDGSDESEEAAEEQVAARRGGNNDDNDKDDGEDYDESGEAMERRAGKVAELLMVARPIARSLLLQVQPSLAGTAKQRKHRKQLNKQLAAAAEASLLHERQQRDCPLWAALGTMVTGEGMNWWQRQ